MELPPHWRDSKAVAKVVLPICYLLFVIVSCSGVLGEGFIGVGIIMVLFGILVGLVGGVVAILAFLIRKLRGA